MSLALFDLDQTLIPYDTQALFCQHILKRHPLRRAYLLAFLPVLPFATVKLIGERGLKRVFLNYLYGMTKAQVEQEVKEFVAETVLPLIYPSVLEELQKHQANGLTTVLNSASPDIYAHEIARALKFDHCFATRIDLAGHETIPFTPKIIGPNNKREAKLVAMAHLLPPDRPIPGSFAYSDSHADLPMLRIVEHAVMVHPTPTLAAEGNAKGWKTMAPPRPFQTKGEHVWHVFKQVIGA